MRYYGENCVDGILADLGVSSHHFDSPGRGFSFRFEGDLDMRMNQSSTKNAAKILNEYPENQLSSIFSRYGELNNAGKIAAAIVRSRDIHPVSTIEDFVKILEPFTFRDKEKKILAQAFQALRIEVNDEMEALREMLRQSLQMLRKGGRMSVDLLSFTRRPNGEKFFSIGQCRGKN